MSIAAAVCAAVVGVSGCVVCVVESGLGLEQLFAEHEEAIATVL